MRVHGYSEQNHASSPLFCPLPSLPPSAARTHPPDGPAAPARRRGRRPFSRGATATRSRGGGERGAQSESQNSRPMLSLHNLQLAAAVVDDEVRVKRRFMRIG